MNKPLRLWNDYDRPHSDLREAIDRMERAGELLRTELARWPRVVAKAGIKAD